MFKTRLCWTVKSMLRKVYKYISMYICFIMLIIGSSSTDIIELIHSLFSPDQWQLNIWHSGTERFFSIISGNSSEGTVELHLTPRFPPDQWQFVYKHCGSETSLFFPSQVAVCLQALWNCITPYFPQISGNSSEDTVELHHPLFSPLAVCL